jgi:hypothetical protein
MIRERAAAQTEERSELLGIRVTAALKTKVKVEAARRGLTIAQLFEEIWQIYREQERTNRD